MLVQWGTDIADEAHIPCYVEGTAAGYKLYRKKGFEDVDAIDMDLSRYGGKGLSQADISQTTISAKIAPQVEAASSSPDEVAANHPQLLH
jgi:hypothetical protein